MCHKQLNQKAKGRRIAGAKKPRGTHKRLHRAEGEGMKGKAAGDNTMGGLFLRGGPQAVARMSDSVQEFLCPWRLWCEVRNPDDQGD